MCVSIQCLQKFTGWFGLALSILTRLPSRCGGIPSTLGRGGILTGSHGTRGGQGFYHLLDYPSGVVHCFVKRASVVCRFEGSGPPGSRHDNNEDAVLTTCGQFSPVRDPALLLWKWPPFALTPGRLTGGPPCDPCPAIRAGIIDVG